MCCLWSFFDGLRPTAQVLCQSPAVELAGGVGLGGFRGGLGWGVLGGTGLGGTGLGGTGLGVVVGWGCGRVVFGC